MAMCPVQEIIHSTVFIFIVKLHFHISVRETVAGYKPSEAFLFVDTVTLAQLWWSLLLTSWKHTELGILLVCILSEEIWPCSCGGWRLYFVTLQMDIAVQEEMCWAGMALLKLYDRDFIVKHGIKNDLEFNFTF